MESVQWGSSERQRFSFKRGSSTGPWLVVIHGGAWRDPQITDASAHHLIRCVEAAHPNKYGGYASLEYRLSPEVTHPGHLNDVAEGFKQLVHQCEVTHVVLVGHSCGAFLAGQLAEMLGHVVKQIITIEGIYDLYELVREYPDYSGFVSDAFPKSWPRVDWSSLSPIVAIHSKEDELLSLQQPTWLSNQRSIRLVVLPHGKHDEVFEQLDLSDHL